jgi:hypothetical protein
MATAPSFAPNNNIFPLVKPIASDASSAQDFNVIHHFGSLQPWRSVPSKYYGLPDASPVIPDGCEIVQAHLIHRHGARYPTTGTGPAIFAAKVHETANSPSGFDASGDLKFLQNWTYKLGAEILTPTGRSQVYVVRHDGGKMPTELPYPQIRSRRQFQSKIWSVNDSPTLLLHTSHVHNRRTSQRV